MAENVASHRNGKRAFSKRQGNHGTLNFRMARRLTEAQTLFRPYKV
jgi:hypothetical protein